MSTNIFMNNNKNFTNIPSQPDSNAGNKSQTNPIINGINSQLKNDSNNLLFNQKKETNPFVIKNEPNSNNLNININQKENNNNNYNSFRLLNTQPNNDIKASNNINFSQNSKNNILLNNNSINNNNNNNQSQKPPNIFNNTKESNNPFNIIPKNNNPSNNNIISTINTNQIKNEEKKEQSNIFLSQSNNILNKSNNNNNISNQSQNISQIKNSSSQIPNLENKIGNAPIPIPEQKENKKVNDFINNLLAEDKIMFSEKEKMEFEKRQLSYKTNGEIIDEFKTMLLSQKEKYLKLTNNARIFESKFMNLLNKIKNNSYATLDTEIKMKKLLDKIQLTETKVSKLKSNMINKDTIMTKGLDYLKKNLNNNVNNFTSMTNRNFEENNSFYKELIETSDKIRKIDANIKMAWNTMTQNKNNKDELNEIYNKENNRNKFNSDIDGDGVIIERIDKENNKINKIYVEQKDVNNILTECYEGLYSLKCAQDEFDNKYNILKNKLINKIKENNNNSGKRNIPDEDFNL